MSDEMSGVVPPSMLFVLPLSNRLFFLLFTIRLTHNSFGFHNLLTLVFNPMYAYETLQNIGLKSKCFLAR